MGFDAILVETSGIGQGDGAITEVSDISLYVTTREYGAPSQLEKLAALDFADLVVLNKFDRSGAEDALKEIRKQVQRNRTAFDQPLEAMPVVPTIASQFADAGVDLLWSKVGVDHNDRERIGASMPPSRSWAPTGSHGASSRSHQSGRGTSLRSQERFERTMTPPR